jgi:hypothetical protein
MFTSMIAVLLVYDWRSLFAISQSGFLNEFKACECIQLIFTTSQLVIYHLPTRLWTQHKLQDKVPV